MDEVLKMYNTLKLIKGRSFNPRKYMWKIGVYRASELIGSLLTKQARVGHLTLMGIRADIDYSNPQALGIYEELTEDINSLFKEE